MTTKTKTKPSFYSIMHKNNDDDQIFSDERIQRYDVDTIKHRYGDNWRNYASNVREIKQADGSIVRGKQISLLQTNVNNFHYIEYIIDDPNLLNEIKPTLNSTSKTANSDDKQQLSKAKFAEIRAKFEKKSVTNTMASPSPSSSMTSSNTATTATRRGSNKQHNDLYSRNRQGSKDSLAMNHTNVDVSVPSQIHSDTSQSTSSNNHSRSISNSSFRRFNSADEADEEVHRIHRQGKEIRYHHETLSPLSSFHENKQPSDVQYEVIDEDGNPVSIDGVHDLIKMSGVKAREVPQSDGTIVREYVIDDPNILSKFRPQSSPTSSQQRIPHSNIPPPPPRVPLKQPVLFHPGPISHNYQPPINIEQIQLLESRRLYEYITKSGKRIEFMITNIESDNQITNESDIRDLTNAINTRLIPPLSSSSSSSISHNPQQQPFTLPKTWYPTLDLTHRAEPIRQRTNSDSQSVPPNYNVRFQQVPPSIQNDLTRSTSYGALNQNTYQQQFAPVFTEPIIDWSALRQQDPHGQIDSNLVQQFIAQKHQNESIQTSAQFLPQQKQHMTRSINSPLRNNASKFYQQQISYPYQGQQQHGVRIVSNNNDWDLNEQQPTIVTSSHTRI